LILVINLIINPMAIYRILTAVLAATAATEGRPSEPYIKATVQADDTEERNRLAKIYGHPVEYGVGGTPLNYPILSNDAMFSQAQRFIDSVAVGTPITSLVKGERVKAKVPQHYIVNPNTGKKALDEKGNPRTKDEIMFFCPDGASETTLLRQLSRKLDFVLVEGAREGEAADGLLN
jgi:hypothetical protein